MTLSGRFMIVLCGLLLAGCQSDPYDVDTSQIAYDPVFLRLDHGVFDLPKRPTLEDLQALRNTFDGFADLYFEDIMRVGPVDNPMTAELFGRFLSDPVWRALQVEIDARHPDLSQAEARIGDAFKRYAVLFDADTLPTLVAYNSGFNVGIFPTAQWLGVGLEWYSGSDYDIIDRLPPDLFPQYKRDKMLPKYLAPNAVKGWLLVHFSDRLVGDDLLARMVYTGKVLFVARALMAGLSEADALNYSEETLNWCQDHEFDVWKHFVENELVFTKDNQAINKMVGDGPFTPGMPPESPGGIGNWVGLQMVDSYMKAHPKTTLKQLMELQNDRAILQTYKPGR